MNADGGIEIGICGPQDGGRGSARGEARDEDTGPIDREIHLSFDDGEDIQELVHPLVGPLLEFAGLPERLIQFVPCHGGAKSPGPTMPRRCSSPRTAVRMRAIVIGFSRACMSWA